MTTQQLFLTVFAFLSVSAFGLASTKPADGWKAVFDDGTEGSWKPYGSGCEIGVVMDDVLQRNVLNAAFDDSSEGAWANKGIFITLKEPISWSSFKYVHFLCQMNRKVSSVGCLLHDKNGGWWRNFRADLTAPNQWTVAAFKKDSFTFTWNDDAKIAAGKMDAGIAEIYLYVGTEGVNKKANYSLRLTDVTFGAVLPEFQNYAASVSAKTVDSVRQAKDDSAQEEAGVEPFPLQWKVSSLNKSGNFVVDGKPFFPLGLYSCFGIDEASATHRECHYTGAVTKEKCIERMKVIKEAGFNTLQTYTMQFYGTKVAKPGWHQENPGDVVEPTNADKLREGMVTFMDYAQSVGLKVMIGGSHPYCIEKEFPKNNRAEALEKLQRELKANIMAWKDHPALLAWYLIDEPYNENSNGNMPVADLRDVYRYVKSLDTAHPMIFASCDWAFPSGPSDTRYRKATDIIAPDVYPVGAGVPIQMIANRLDNIKKCQEGKPPMPQAWAVIQIWQAPGIRLPSSGEMRVMALLAMTRDVKGLLFYNYANYPEKEPQHWANVSEVVNSLHTVIPDVLAPSRVVTQYRVSDPRVFSIMRRISDKKSKTPDYSLIAVNPIQNVVFEPMALGPVMFELGKLKLKKDAAVTVYDEDERGNFKRGSLRRIPLTIDEQGCRFTDEFGEYAAHVYRIGSEP